MNLCPQCGYVMIDQGVQLMCAHCGLVALPPRETQAVQPLTVEMLLEARRILQANDEPEVAA